MSKQENLKTEEFNGRDEEKNDRENEAEKPSVLHRVLSIIGIVISALALPVLILNIVFLVQSFLHPKEVPGIFGITPMVVVTDSMKPVISAGDMIVDRKIDANEIKVGDIISFFDPTRPDNDVVLTHRVKEISGSGKNISFRTQGDANNIPDSGAVTPDKIVGIYRRTIPVIGNVVLFMKTPTGIFVSVILPVLLVVTCDLIRKKISEKNAREERVEAAKGGQKEPVTVPESPGK